MIIYDKNGNERFSNVEKFTYNDTFMGENFLNMDINSDVPIPFDIGDYCIFRNDRFELNYKPSVEKTSSRNSSGDAFTYSSIKMNSIADELTRCPFSDIVPSDYNVVWTGLTDFTFYAKTADMLGRRIQTCLDEMYAYQTSRIKILSGVSTNGIITITLNGNSIGIPVTTSCNTPSLLASYISGLSFNGYNLIYISGNDYLDFKATTKGTGLPPSITFGTTGSTGNINEIVKGNSWTVIVNKDNLVDYNKSVCNILQDDGQYRSSNGNLPIDSYMSFNNKTCSEALAELYNTFYVTYIVRGRTITVAPVGNLVGHTFGYDSDGGLLSLEKQTKQDSLLITRLSCFGSTRNISTKYYANLTGFAKSTINADAESFQTDRFTFKSGASSAGSLNFTLNGDTYIVNGITTSHNTDEKIASYVYSNSSVFSDKWNLKLYNIQKKIRLTFTKNKEYQSLCSLNLIFGDFHFYPYAIFFNSNTGLSDFAKDISSSLDDEQFSQCGWSKSYIEGTSYIEFTCNIGGIQETPNIYIHSQGISNTLSLLVAIKTEGVSYIDFTRKIAIRCSPPSFNGNSTGVTATTETISYGQISYAELSDNTGYYFSLDFQAGASIYKKAGSINGIPILIDGKTTYQVKFKIGIYEVSGYIVLENYLVTGFVYNTETNYNNFISLLSSNPTIYITEGVYLDMLSSEYVNYSTTLSNNLAVTHLMLPNFPLVESNPNNIFIDSDNITKYGIRKAVVFFDGSDAQHPEICPTIKDMTAKEVEDAGMSLSLDSNEGSDLTKIRLDEIKDCENPTDDGYIPTSIDSSYPGTTWFYLYIKDLGFDLSAMTGDNKYYYATTENMEVSMISGDCTGRTFKVTKIEKDTSLGYLRYKLTCDRYQDTNINKQYPNSDYKIEEGDIFVLLNIKLPQVYVLASSQKLLAYGNACISKNDETKFQYVPRLEPQWMYEHSNGVDGISDTIHAGDLFDFSDTDLDVSGKVFIKTLTINVGTEQIPTYDITLDDEVESTTYQKIQNNIDNIMNQSSGSGTSSGTSSQTDLSNKYISKEKDDSTQYSLGVGKDLKVGGGINTSGNSVVEGDSSVVGKQTVGGDNNVIGNSDIGGDNTIGGNQNITGEIISKNFNAENKVGFAVKKKDDSHYKLSITDLEIWGKAIFNSLEVRRLVSVGGNYMFSPANGTILTVQEFGTYYRCYLLADDGTTATENGFNVNDNVLCETFNIKEGIYENVSNKRYWRTIVSVSNASEILYDKGLVYWGQVDADHLVYDSDGNPITYISESPLYEGKKFYYIDLSKTLCETGSDIPSAGDEIATFGNTTDMDRQNSIYITSVGDDAPAIKLYAGISGFSIEEKDYVSFGVDKEKNKAFLKVYGEEYIGSRDLSTYLKFTQENGVEIKGKLSEGTKLEDGTEVNSLPANIQNLATTVDGFHSGVFNIIRNSGFTGDYQNLELDTDTALNTDTDLYNNKLVCWDNSNAVVSTDTYTQSGYSCSISSGYISQSLYYQQISNESYVMSIKAKGASMTIEVGGKTFNQVLTPEFSIYNFKYKSNGGTIFRIAGTCVVSEVELAVGTVPLSWSQSPLDNHKMFDRFQAIKYVTDAMADGSVQFSGGLALMTMIMLGNYQDGQMLNVTSGLSGIYNNDDDVSFWSGGTFEQAIAAVQMFKNNPTYQPTSSELEGIAKAVITHGGRIIMNDAVLRGYVYALGGIFKNIKLSGSIRNPFENSTGTFNIDTNDNVIVLGNGNEDIDGKYTLPWTIDNNGRKIIIANYKYNGNSSTGFITIYAPEGKYIFDNGGAQQSLGIPKNGIVELLGIGDSTNLYGWFVLHKKNFNDTGIPMSALAYGQVFTSQGTDSIVSSLIYKTSSEGVQMDVERLSTGSYKITHPDNYLNNCIVMLTGVKGMFQGSGAVNACVIDQNFNYFLVETHDDSSLNDGSFNFIIYNLVSTFNRV